MKIYTNNFKSYYCIYAAEIYNIFKNSHMNVDEQSEANYIITCLSDELNYPNYGNMDSVRGEKGIENIIKFVSENVKTTNNQKIITFYHILNGLPDNMINVCYSKTFNDTKSIVICPPAINKFSFNKRANKPYLVSFKGNVYASSSRHMVYEKLKYYNNQKNIIIHRTDESYEYADLMTNSTFSIIIEDDLPWSYRLTECINAGSIPVIIKPRSNSNIYAFDELIDYSEFSIVVNEYEIDKLMTDILPNMPQEQIKKMLAKLETVNTKYFISRETQMCGVLEILKTRMHRKNVGLVMFYDNAITKYANINRKINEKYCEKYNLELVVSNNKRYPNRHSAWERLPLMLETLSRFDYLVWIDADAFFYSDANNIVDIITGREDYSFIFSRDIGNVNINTGVFIVKNCEYSINFLKVWAYDEFLYKNNPFPCWWDQGVLLYMFSRNILNIQTHSVLIDYGILQHMSVERDDKLENTLIMHFAGRSADERYAVSTNYFNTHFANK